MSLALLWILVSDRVVTFLFPDLGASSLAQTIKGIAFVLITGALLFTLIRRELRGRIKAEVELERAMDQTVQLNAQLARFAHATSHELVEPTRSMAGFAQLLERRLSNDLSAEDREMLGFLESGAKRLHRLVSDTAAYAAMDQAPDRTKVFALTHPLERALQRLRQDGVITDGIVETDSTSPLLVMANPVLMESVFTNLLSNALRFAHPERPPKVRVGLHPDPSGQAVVEVEDNGVGIPEEHRNNVFLPFFRLRRDGTLQKDEGSGFGLPACRRIVEWYGGTIEAKGNAHGGTRIVFTLPLAEESREIPSVARSNGP